MTPRIRQGDPGEKDKSPSATQSDNLSWIRHKVGEAVASGIEDLAWLQTAFNQGDPIDTLPVYVTISCGRPNLQIGDINFELACWQALVRLELENANVKQGSQLKVVVQDGSFETQAVSTSKLRTIRDHAIALGLDVRANSLSTSGSLLGKLSFNRNTHQIATDDEKTKATSEIVLIGPFGAAIAIGDPNYGDPHKPYGLLSHDYPKSNGDDIEPLFSIEPHDGKKPIRLSVITAVKFDSLYLCAKDANESDRGFARKEITDRSSEALDDYEVLRRQMFEAELRSRVSRNQRSSGFSVHDNEFVVMIEMFEIRRRTEEDAVAEGAH